MALHITSNTLKTFALQSITISFSITRCLLHIQTFVSILAILVQWFLRNFFKTLSYVFYNQLRTLPEAQDLVLGSRFLQFIISTIYTTFWKSIAIPGARVLQKYATRLWLVIFFAASYFFWQCYLLKLCN